MAGNRRLCIGLKVMSVPSFLFFKGGECIDRLVGDEVSLEAIKAKADQLLYNFCRLAGILHRRGGFL